MTDEICLDLKTPRNLQHTAFFKRSFAYDTVHIRMPIIVQKLIDNLTLQTHKIKRDYKKDAEAELTYVIDELKKLKREIATNQTMNPLKSRANDADFWNQYILKQGATVTYLTAPSLLSECYMYRRFRATFEQTTELYNYDPFMKQKQDGYIASVPIIAKLGGFLLDLLEQSDNGNRDDFCALLKLNLWGNKCDLALSEKLSTCHEHFFNLDELDSKLLSDHSARIWESVVKKCEETDGYADFIGIIFDNAGYELISDLCLADYLVSKNLTSQVRMYVKTIPWFISDVTSQDFHWTLDEMSKSSIQTLRTLATRWRHHVSTKRWQLLVNDFWTLPVSFEQMKTVDETLYRQLSEAKLLIFKGDLNYKKLMGMRNWDPCTPVDEALQGFNPAPLCTLRTIKTDIVCGLPPGVADRLDEENNRSELDDDHWMKTGVYGLIQFSDRIERITN